MTIELINYGTPNKNKVNIGDLSLFFSYSTLVAFHSPASGLVCRENVWSKTTGKFLNEIEPRKEKRVDSEAFNRKLKVAIIDGILKEILKNLALSYDGGIRRHSIGLLKELERSSFENEKNENRC